MSKTKLPSVFIRNNPAAPQLCPELAAEIGLNESILLLQLEYWLTRHGEVRDDGHLWIRKPVREIQETFGFWSVGTINTIIDSLVRKDFVVGAGLDKARGRSGRWLRLNLEKLSSLKSIRVCSDSEQSMFRNTPDPVQDLNNRPYIDLKNKNIDPPAGYKVPKKPAEPKTLYPPEDFQIDSEFETWMAERFICLSPEQRKDALEAWHDSRRSDPSITRPRTLEQWRYDLKKFIRIYWQNAQPRNGNGHGGVVNDQPMMTIQERMRLGLL